MRTDIDPDVVSAITDGTAYLMYESIRVEPTRMYFDTYNSGSNPPSFSQLGISDDPVLQTVSMTSNSKMVFFYNDGGTLKYQVQGISTLVDTGIAIRGQPGCDGGQNFCYVNSSGRLIYRLIDDTQVEALNANPFQTPHPPWAYATDTGVDIPSSNLACHATYYGLAVLYEDEGGIRTKIIDRPNGFTWVSHTQSGRFMFPILQQTSGSSRTIQSILSYSTLLWTSGNEDAFVYISNHITGGVDAVRYGKNTNNFSDVWTAVPADLKSSICEFRVNNSFGISIDLNTSINYMCGTFIRRENVSTYVYYTLLLRSTDGHNWTMDRFCMVSDLPYRNYVAYSYDGPPYKLFIGSFNRVASGDVTWLYDADYYWGSPANMTITINRQGIINLSDDQVTQLDISLAAGNEQYLDHSYIVPGAKVTLETVYQTTSGSLATTYGTYILDAVSKGVRDGSRQLTLSCKNFSTWQLEGMTSPFYTEIISKSSVYDSLSSVDTSQLYTAEFSGLWEDVFSVDFWDTGEPWDGTGVTGIDIHSKGGVERYEATGSHTLGIRTGDLKSTIACEEYPEFYQENAYFEIYGWCYPASGSVNDLVSLHLWLETSSGSLYEVDTAGARWPCTYPSTAAGDYPITVTVTQPIGTKIRELGLKFTNSATSYLYPCRIDCVAGTDVYYGATDANTGWYSAKDKLWKVRGKNRPYIMFSRQPYDTFNFCISGQFTDTVAGYVNDLGPVGYGLVGLAQNGRNYVVGRYNKVTNKLEIVKVRKGQESVLASSTSTISLSGGCYMYLSHIDGNFEIRIRDGSGNWVRQTTYSWKAADSWMFTDEIAAKHTGVYGVITVPAFRITGFDEGGDVDLDRALGMPMLPGYSTLGYFPNSGLADVGENVYSYSGTITYTDIRGPFMYRQHGQYLPPFGDGSWGMHIRDHNRGASSSEYIGQLLAVDDGTVYKVTGTQWNVFDSTRGVRRQLPGRAQYYCQQAILEKAFHTMANRIYVTGGLDNCDLLRGNAEYQPWGEYCYLHTTGDIQLLAFSGSSGDYDFTLEDLVTRLAVNAGATARFPGDITFTGPNPWVAGTWYSLASYDYIDCFEARFITNNMQSGHYYDIKTNVAIDDDDTGIIVRLQYTSGSAVVSLRLQPSDTVYSSWAIPNFNMQATKIRLMFHKQFATVYMDERWMHTFHLSRAIYPTTVTIELRSSAGGTHDPVYLQEMPEWREAIYIDLETDGTSAIQSIIQERPVEVYSRWDGSIAYWYEPNRSTITQSVLPREHSWVDRTPTGAASDAIIYYSEVKTLQYEAFRDAFGFSTKVMRFPNLEAGAIRAANILLEREFSKRRTHSIIIRPDVRIELGDKLDVSYTRTGSQVPVSFTMIVDAMKLMHEPSNNQMVIEGREA